MDLEVFACQEVSVRFSIIIGDGLTSFSDYTNITVYGGMPL